MHYFTYKEFEKSETASRHNIDNHIKEHEVKLNIQVLVEELLDKVRDMYGKPIIVSSGYRSFELNKLIGGARNSQHRRGEAADIVVSEGVSGLRKIVSIVIDNSLPFDQMIWEHSGNGYWIHLSYTRTRVNRGECLIYDNGTYHRHSPQEFRSIICDK